MIKFGFPLYAPEKEIKKGDICRINTSIVIQLNEIQSVGKDVVNIEYSLEDGQYGIYAHEYRRPQIKKDGSKVADVLTCIIDDRKKEIYSLIFDVKRDVSAFSDDLSNIDAMSTAIKNVRKFTQQICAEALHKESFLLFLKDEGYIENAKFGIATSSFEPAKFRAVAEKLQKLVTEEVQSVPTLVNMKLKNNLRAYETEIEPLYNFSEGKIAIGNVIYPLNIFILQKINETDYEVNIKLDNYA